MLEGPLISIEVPNVDHVGFSYLHWTGFQKIYNNCVKLKINLSILTRFPKIIVFGVFSKLKVHIIDPQEGCHTSNL